MQYRLLRLAFAATMTVASCAAEGLAIFTAQSFDLVITDYRMPDMDGVELIQRARAHNGAVPIILISGFSTALGLNEESTGADLVLQKCYTEVPQLIHAVTRLLRKSNTPRKRAGSQRKSAAASKRTG